MQETKSITRVNQQDRRRLKRRRAFLAMGKLDLDLPTRILHLAGQILPVDLKLVLQMALGYFLVKETWKEAHLQLVLSATFPR